MLFTRRGVLPIALRPFGVGFAPRCRLAEQIFGVCPSLGVCFLSDLLAKDGTEVRTTWNRRVLDQMPDLMRRDLCGVARRIARQENRILVARCQHDAVRHCLIALVVNDIDTHLAVGIALRIYECRRDRALPLGAVPDLKAPDLPFIVAKVVAAVFGAFDGRAVNAAEDFTQVRVFLLGAIDDLPGHVDGVVDVASIHDLTADVLGRMWLGTLGWKDTLGRSLQCGATCRQEGAGKCRFAEMFAEALRHRPVRIVVAARDDVVGQRRYLAECQQSAARLRHFGRDGHEFALEGSRDPVHHRQGLVHRYGVEAALHEAADRRGSRRILIGSAGFLGLLVISTEGLDATVGHHAGDAAGGTCKEVGHKPRYRLSRPNGEPILLFLRQRNGLFRPLRRAAAGRRDFTSDLFCALADLAEAGLLGRSHDGDIGLELGAHVLPLLWIGIGIAHRIVCRLHALTGVDAIHHIELPSGERLGILHHALDCGAGTLSQRAAGTGELARRRRQGLPDGLGNTSQRAGLPLLLVLQCWRGLCLCCLRRRHEVTDDVGICKASLPRTRDVEPHLGGKIVRDRCVGEPGVAGTGDVEVERGGHGSTSYRSGQSRRQVIRTGQAAARGRSRKAWRCRPVPGRSACRWWRAGPQSSSGAD